MYRLPQTKRGDSCEKIYPSISRFMISLLETLPASLVNGRLSVSTAQPPRLDTMGIQHEFPGPCISHQGPLVLCSRTLDRSNPWPCDAGFQNTQILKSFLLHRLKQNMGAETLKSAL